MARARKNQLGTWPDSGIESSSNRNGRRRAIRLSDQKIGQGIKHLCLRPAQERKGMAKAAPINPGNKMPIAKLETFANYLGQPLGGGKSVRHIPVQQRAKSNGFGEVVHFIARQ